MKSNPHPHPKFIIIIITKNNNFQDHPTAAANEKLSIEKKTSKNVTKKIPLPLPFQPTAASSTFRHTNASDSTQRPSTPTA
jgi:hypothetical protein